VFRTDQNETRVPNLGHQQESPTDGDGHRDVRPKGQHVICGMCNSYPASWSASQWRCSTVQDSRRASDDACELWRPREEWKPDPPMYSRIDERSRHKERLERALGARPEPQVTVRPTPCFVYFMTCGNFVKIGRSEYPQSRLETLQAGSPYTIEIAASFPGPPALEKALHKKFDHLRHAGEWFTLSDEIRDEMKKLRKKSYREEVTKARGRGEHHGE